MEADEVCGAAKKIWAAVDGNCLRQRNLRLMIDTKAHGVKRASVLLLTMTLSCAWFQCGFAEADPSTAVNFLFSGSAAPIYDLTGGYRFDQQVSVMGGNTVNLSFPLSFTQDAAGRLQGSGLTTVRVGSDSLAASYVVNGRLSGGGRLTRATFVVRLEGQDAGADGHPSLRSSIRYSLAVSARGLNGTARGSANLAKLGRGSIQSLISGVPLPAGVDGSWSVQLAVVGADRLAGTGAILLPNGRSLQASLTGNSSTDSGVGRIKLSGVDQDRGNTLNLSLSGQTNALRKLSGRILGQTVSGAPVPAQYAGSRACIECHGPMYQTVTNTFHAQVGVQCEDCHGAAADHAANCYDPLVRPKVDLTGTACGACHSGSQHPVYEEWQTSGHAVVTEDMNPTNRIDSCGRCHSGSVRLSLLANAPLPYGEANVPIGCPTCHETHSPTVHPALLRNPVASTEDYYLTTTTNFASAYNPDINICAQCHNHRGASWTSTSRPPHHSPQYNMLLGTVGELDTGVAPNEPGSHALLPGQCVDCHMQTADYVSQQEPAITGHSFQVELYRYLPQLPSVAGIAGGFYHLVGVEPDPADQIRIGFVGQPQGPGTIMDELWSAILGIHHPGRLVPRRLGSDGRRPGADPDKYSEGAVQPLSGAERRQFRRSQWHLFHHPFGSGQKLGRGGVEQLTSPGR